MYSINREVRKRNTSKARLSSLIESKIKTTMIGAISDIEKMMGDFIKTEDGERIFTELRESILDRGNYQIRSMKDELESYEIVFNGYVLKSILKEDK